ncbi:MAG TPA: exosortase/archaeosortase family protein [Candidatus Polarisedimenticolia bacterium]|nr:exosortase/archaeosortase family protein [Candidatus Polarisedimenticolia bacterium]
MILQFDDLLTYHYLVPSTTNRESVPGLSPRLLFSILSAISLAIWFGPLISSFTLALHDDQYTQILLIIPVSAALIFLDWKSPVASTAFSLTFGAILLASAALITAVAKLSLVALHPDEQLSVRMLALVAWWIGSFILSFGARSFKRSLFPLCFLFWIVPLPELVLNPIVRLLQDGSAASAHLLFAAVGVPVTQDGTLITIPGLTIEVARECSSIRSSLMLVVTTMLLAQMLLRSPWRKAALIAVAIPLSVVKNGLRIFVLGMLGTRVDPSFLTGRLHHQGGIIYFLIALAAIFLLLWMARRGDEQQGISR